MRIVTSKTLTADQKKRICGIWNQEYPVKLATSPGEFDIYLDKSTDHLHFVLIDQEDYIWGWAYTFHRDGERWFSILLDRKIHGQGWGKALIEALQQKESALNGWVMDHDNDFLADGQTYASPLAFYLLQGFTELPTIRLETEKMSAVKINWHREQ